MRSSFLLQFVQTKRINPILLVRNNRSNQSFSQNKTDNINDASYDKPEHKSIPRLSFATARTKKNKPKLPHYVH